MKSDKYVLIVANQTPGVVTFDNYEKVKSRLQLIIYENFEGADYE